jgi:hypothetical protein
MRVLGFGFGVPRDGLWELSVNSCQSSGLPVAEG